jgi:hypothetical protein
MPIYDTTSKYIQSPYNPNASIPNPNYKAPTVANLGTNNLTKPTTQTINTNGSPSITPNYGDIQATITGITSQLGEMTKSLATIQSAQPTTPAKPEKTGILDTLQGMVTQRQETAAAQPTQEEMTNKVYAQYGVSPESYTEIQGLVGQLTSYNQQIVDLDAKKTNAINIAGEQAIDKGMLLGQQAKIEKDYNAQIAAKSAQAGVVAQTIQLKQGLIQDARTTAGLIIDAMTYDAKQKVADMDWAINTYKDVYDIMSEEEQQQWDNAYKLAELDYDANKTELNQIMDLVIKNPGANINPITDDFATAIQKFNATPPTSSTNTPTSYDEWSLAGGEEGTGMSYADWLQRQNLTQTDRDRSLKTAAFTKAKPELEASRGKDGYIDPGTYMRLRTDYGAAIGDPNEFDEMFASMLSLKERLRLGVGKVQI